MYFMQKKCLLLVLLIHTKPPIIWVHLMCCSLILLKMVPVYMRQHMYYYGSMYMNHCGVLPVHHFTLKKKPIWVFFYKKDIAT